MALRRRTHPSLPDVDDELLNLDEAKEDKITLASRAPNSGDKGRFWCNYAGSSGNRFYFRHPTSGAWTLV
jgi:hypothetical protein